MDISEMGSLPNPGQITLKEPHQNSTITKGNGSQVGAINQFSRSIVLRSGI